MSCEQPAGPSRAARAAERTARAESLGEPFGEPSIRRYAMHWLQHAAACINRRSESTHRQRLLNVTVLGIDHLFDTSDVPSRPHGLRRGRLAHTSDPGVGRYSSDPGIHRYTSDPGVGR